MVTAKIDGYSVVVSGLACSPRMRGWYQYQVRLKFRKIKMTQTCHLWERYFVPLQPIPTHNP